jgi:hypothetical protein
LDIILSTKIV